MTNTIDVYRVINGVYMTNSLYDTINVIGINDSTEMDTWTEKHNVHFVNEDILVDNHTKQPKYFIR